MWHLVTTVEGRLVPGTGCGAPSARGLPLRVGHRHAQGAVQLIEELEPARRSWYCGAIGFLSAGAADTTVARTAVANDGWADDGAGGGIVAGSDPADEHHESLAKAAAFLADTNAALLVEEHEAAQAAR